MSRTKSNTRDEMRKRFAGCALEVEAEYQMGGLSGDLYEDYAWDIFRKMLPELIQRIREEAIYGHLGVPDCTEFVPVTVLGTIEAEIKGEQ